jgi:hypothetical protein
MPAVLEAQNARATAGVQDIVVAGTATLMLIENEQ